MSPSQLQREMELFHQLLDAAPDARERRLSALRSEDAALAARLQELLAGHERAEAAAPTRHLESFRETLVETPERIGSYRILERLGEGGMGVVYAAEQAEPVRRRVAIKVVKSGADSEEVIARFHAERQALALMKHANIAQILDAGVHEGRPYFVMELISGIPITEYCDRRQLSIEERLRLFVEMCGGVQHAHQKGVIHRDLKPTNVLVTEEGGSPSPKIIDFGIAKAVTDRLLEATVHTEMGRIVGTPDYMSPEQADTSALDIDTRADVYSLGAMLYELLCGSTVFGLHDRRAGLDEIRTAIRTREPRRPSTRLTDSEREGTAEDAERRRSDPERLARTLRQDLDWITLKALEKDRVRRYASASELAADVGRYLRGEPVQARPPSTSYRLKKFVRRHKAASSAAAVVAAALVLFASISASFALSELKQRRAVEESNQALAEEKARSEALRVEAEAERDRVTAMLRFLTIDLLGAARPSPEMGQGRDVTMRDVLDAASSRIDVQVAPGAILAGMPVVEAQLRATIGATYFDLGEYPQAERHLLRSYELAMIHLGPAHYVVLDVLTRLGPTYRALGRPDEAERFYRESHERARAAHGDESPDVLIALGNLGVFLQHQGALDESEAIQREVLARRVAAFGEDDETSIAAASSLAAVLELTGKRDEAVEVTARALGVARQSLGPGHPRSVILLSNHGTLLERAGRLEEALPLLEEAVERSRELFGPAHNGTGAALNSYAMALKESGRQAEALDVMLESLAIFEASLGAGHPNILVSKSNIAGVLRDLGEYDRALPYSAAAVAGSGDALPEGHWMRGLLRVRHAESLAGVGQYTEAVELGEDGYQTLALALGAESDRARDAARVIAGIHDDWYAASSDPAHAQEAGMWRVRSGEISD